MILFYAQSGNNEVVVTAPLLTFPATTASGLYSGPRIYAVQPVKYTLLDGTVEDFKYTDIEKFIFIPKNNGHNIFKIKFSKTFKGKAGCTLTLRANFSGSRFQSFNLPFTASTTLAETHASTEPLTISVSAKGAALPITSYKVYENSSLVGDPITALTSGASIDTNNYRSVSTGVLEIIGVTIDQAAASINAERLDSTMLNERTKFLSNSIFSDPAHGVSPYANYFYIYAEECDKEKAVAAAQDCFDAHADNTSTNSGTSLNINSCDYARRAPNNVTIEHVPGGKTSLASIKWMEENLPDNIVAVANFDVHTVTTIVSGSGVADATPTTEALNIDGDNTTTVFEWIDIDSDSEFITPFYDGRDKSAINLSSNIGGSDNNRVYYFGIFRTQAAGCMDSTAINFDTNAVRDDGSCVFCDTVAGQVSGGLSFTTKATSNAVAVDDDDNSDFKINTTITNVGSELITYLETLASTVWTCKIYKEEDISLNAFGDAATSGTAILTLANDGSSTLPIFKKVPTSSSGLNSGRKFVAEIILTLGSCVHYFYQSFGVPFNGCLSPSATNYVPNSLNTGRGNCDYDTANRSFCDGLITTTEPVGEFVGPGNSIWSGFFTILGTFDENGISLNTEESPSYEVYTQVSGENSVNAMYLGGVDAQPITYALLPEQYIIAWIYDLNTGCETTVIVHYPDLPAVEGCTNPTALNYNPNATEDDGSCLLCSDLELTVESSTNPGGTCSSSDSTGIITFAVDNLPVTGGAFTIYWAGPTPGNGYVAIDYVSGSDLVQTGLGPGIYNAYAIVTLGPGFTCQVPLSEYTFLTVDTSGCGCMDPNAENYESTATEDDGSCLIYGCTNSLAINYNREATTDDESCVYAVSDPMCIPTELDNAQTYNKFLKGLATCVVDEGRTLLLKIKSGIKCDTLEQVKLSLITYLLNRIGLECMYNCNYIFPQPDVAVSCAGNWAIGGPSGEELVWTMGTTYGLGDILKYTNTFGVVYYYNVISSSGYQANYPPTSSDGKLELCKDVVLPSGTETYLNTFINFTRKFCTVCIVDSVTQKVQMKAIADTINDIQFENGDNIELNG